MMPKKFIGRRRGLNNYNGVDSRIWTTKEISWLKQLRSKGYSLPEIAKSLGRTKNSVTIKIKRLMKNTGKDYNSEHIQVKNELNKRFLRIIKPETILDLYAGEVSWYDNKKKYHLISNDIMTGSRTTYHLDALKCLAVQYAYTGFTEYDLVDLDPFGSAYECFDLAIRCARKGLVITFGEMGNQRFRRVDFVNPRYGIVVSDNKEQWIEKMIDYVITRGELQKKKLIPILVGDWKNIFRVYFKVKELPKQDAIRQKRKKIILVRNK